MNKKKNLLKPMLLVGILGLTSCGPNGQTSIVIPEFDPNSYETEVDLEVAKNRIYKAITNSSKVDEMRVTSDVKKIEYGNVLLDLETPNASKKMTSTSGKYKQVNNISGLTSLDPNAIMESTTMQDIELRIKKDGICPEENDDIQTVGCKVDTYIKNNRQYVSFDDPTLREYLPYILYGFGNFASIEDAKEEANKVPEKFYLPGEVFKKENLPIGGGLGQLSMDDMTTAFNYIIDLNNEFDTKFLTFTSNDDDLLMNIDLNSEHIREIIIKIMKQVKPDFDASMEKTFRQFFSTFVVIEACDFYFLIDKNNQVTYQNIKIDFSIRSTQDVEVEPGVVHSHAKRDFTTIDIENFIEYKNVIISYPKDLNSYKEYDLKLPNLPVIPTDIQN